MPFNANVTEGTVIYSPGNFDSLKMVTHSWHITGNDGTWSPGPPTTIGSYGPRTSQIPFVSPETGETWQVIEPLEVAIGKYERMILKYHIHYDQHTDGRIKFRLHTPSDIAQIHTAATGLMANGDAIAGPEYISNTVDPDFDLDEAGTTGYLEWEAVVQMGPTAGAVRLQFAQHANDNGGPAVIKSGSYVEYMRF